LPCDVLLVDGYDSDGLPARLSRARFYDDCHAALEPDGVMVVNLHAGHARFEVLLDRMRRSFDGSVLVVHTSDRSNSIAFAFKGRALGALRHGPLRPPTGMTVEAFTPLRADLACVVAALSKAQAGDGRRTMAQPGEVA
jgi:spermidine synthase